MHQGARHEGAGADSLRRLYVYNGGFLTQARIRRLLGLAGWQLRAGLPGPEDWVGVWGQSPTAWRGEAVAARRGARLLRIEDAFLRSVLPGRAGEPPLGLLIDRQGVHFDPSRPSDLEDLLATHPLDDTALLDAARHAMARMRAAGLSKYNAFEAALPHPLGHEPHVLVIDQTRGDASVRASGATTGTFRDMLVEARLAHPHLKVLVKTHPETAQGFRPGHFGPEDENEQVRLVRAPISPWLMLESAEAVYTVSSGMGFEAILAGHKPQVFGQPWYAGWGLTEDRRPVDRRRRKLTRAQLFAAAMILYPTWYDPFHDRLAGVGEVIDTLEARARAWREDRRGYVATGMRAWKRQPLRRFFGTWGRVRFVTDGARAARRARALGTPLLVWAAKAGPEHEAPGLETRRVEDGFLRSRGLGAQLVPPLSLVADDLGIYYDPGRESRLERLIAQPLGPEARERSERLVAQIVALGLSKYNLGPRPLPELPPGRRILVPGQVEDDASIRLGCPAERTNLALLERARAENPQAVIVYKPHPDVEAGLRQGAVPERRLAALADVVAHEADPIALIDAVDEVWTLTSLLGFEALLRGKPVTCLGLPFYAGWGLTRDLAPMPARRSARPDLLALAHAALIAYPRYHDPVTRAPCPPEVAVARLAAGPLPGPGPANRLLSRLQDLFSGQARLWR